ncbi:MAG: SpoIIE family protein phosphatase [Spirochaetota bacterium]
MMDYTKLVLAFFSSPEWGRFIAAFLLFLYGLKTPMRSPFFKGLLAVPVVLMLRDALLFFFAEPLLLMLSEVVIIGLYAAWIGAYRHKKFGIVQLVVTALIGGILLYYRMTDQSPLLMRFLMSVFLAGCFGLLVYHLYNVSHKSAPGAEFVENNRANFITLYVFILLIIIFVPYKFVLVRALLLPMTYAVHAFVFLKYREEANRQTSVDLDFMRKYLNSTFDFMKTINEALSERSAVQQVLEFVASSIVEATRADGGTVLLINPESNQLEVKSLKGYYPPPYEVPDITKQKVGKIQVYFESTPIPIGKTILGEVAESREQVYIQNAAGHPRLAEQNSDKYSYASSLIVLPLVASGRIFGVLSVAKRTPGQMFTQQDYERCVVFADYTALTIEALYNYTEIIEKQEIEREVSIAADIQKWLVPEDLPRIPGIDVAAVSYPARGVSGDYYDVIPLRKKGKAVVLICDVAGKGVPASLVMVMIRTIVHLIAGAGRDVAKVVSLINRGVAGNVSIERFATLSYLTVDLKTGRVEYCNAGHHPLLVYRAATGAFETFDTDGLPIGLEKSSEYEHTHLQLRKDDVVMLYTDGVTEAMNYQDEQFGEDRVKNIVANVSVNGSSAFQIMQAIFTGIDKFVGGAPQHDDETLIILKKK